MKCATSALEMRTEANKPPTLRPCRTAPRLAPFVRTPGRTITHSALLLAIARSCLVLSQK